VTPRWDRTPTDRLGDTPRPCDEEWGPLRASGCSDRRGSSSRTTDVSIKAPETVETGIQPQCRVLLRNADGTGACGEVAIALVDEGVLSLTTSRTPDPWSFFTARRASAQASSTCTTSYAAGVRGRASAPGWAARAKEAMPRFARTSPHWRRAGSASLRIVPSVTTDESGKA
jgi:uncharacterized protein YfaS (alpha-2-macroglobulin family)